jgi:hypothetical protein
MSAPLEPPELTCYRLKDDAPAIIPARLERDWMDATDQRFAYRCTPVSIANSSGWELIMPFSIEATYFGGNQTEGLQVRALDNEHRASDVAVSHFGHGVLSFHPGYVFRTSPGWAIWARGTPNSYRDKIVPLEGLIETDWLSTTFTMNWRFNRTGSVRFNKGEAFCFITLVPHAILDDIQPRLLKLEDTPELKVEHDAFNESRRTFNRDLKVREPNAVAQGWQKHYIRGQPLTGGPTPIYHVTKRRMRAPEE